MAVDIGIGLFHIVTVFLDGVGEAHDVVVGVVAHLMTFSDDALIEFRVLTDIVAHHEERGLGSERLQRVEDERRSLRDGTVVEGQIYCLLVTVHSPIGFRIEPAEVDGGLLNKHLLTLSPFHFFTYSPLLVSATALRLIDAHQTLQLLFLLVSLFLADGILYIEQLL